MCVPTINVESLLYDYGGTWSGILSLASTSSTDYCFTSGSVTFAPGQMEQTVTVPVFGDALLENDESFFLNLFGTDSAEVEGFGPTGAILNDDPVVVSVGSDHFSIDEGWPLMFQAAVVNAEGTGQVTFSLEGAPQGASIDAASTVSTPHSRAASDNTGGVPQMNR